MDRSLSIVLQIGQDIQMAQGFFSWYFGRC